MTARYLRGDAEIKEPKQRRAIQKRKLSIYGASEHNLKAIDVEIPLDMLVCVTGVSGSGKSTLIHDCIYAGLKKQRGDWQGHVGAFQRVEGGQLIDDVILVDQSPIGRTPRSNPVTYIKFTTRFAKHLLVRVKRKHVDWIHRTSLSICRAVVVKFARAMEQ